ncbi:hypothetical protein GCM10010519_77980 [Streptomyces lactacystinicus]
MEITVVEPQAYFTYHPLLAEVAAGSIDPRHVVVPLRRVLPDCRVLTARITRIEHAARRALADAAGPGETPAPVELPYDVLVVAPGSVSRTAPVPGLAEHGLGFSTVGEAVGLRNHVLEQLDLASATRDPALRQSALTFVFVGAGYAGVGALAELEDMTRTAVRGYHNVRAEDLHWVLVEATGRILAEESPELAAHTLGELRERGVDIRLHTTLESVADRVVVLSDGSRFGARTLVWTAGVRPAPLLRETDLPLDTLGRVRCLATLQAVGPDGRALPGVWAAGDCAAVPDPNADGAPCAPNAQHAFAQAELLARNVVVALDRGTDAPGLADHRPGPAACSTSLRPRLVAAPGPAPAAAAERRAPGAGADGLGARRGVLPGGGLAGRDGAPAFGLRGRVRPEVRPAVRRRTGCRPVTPPVDPGRWPTERRAGGWIGGRNGRPRRARDFRNRASA